MLSIQSVACVQLGFVSNCKLPLSFVNGRVLTIECTCMVPCHMLNVMHTCCIIACDNKELEYFYFQPNLCCVFMLTNVCMYLKQLSLIVSEQQLRNDEQQCPSCKVKVQ